MRGEIHFTVDAAQFFQVGRPLQRNWSGKYLGPVSISISQGKLTMLSKRGGGEIPCQGEGEISAELSAGQFRKLICSRRRQKSPSGPLRLTFRPKLGELALDDIGVKAHFPPTTAPQP